VPADRDIPEPDDVLVEVIHNTGWSEVAAKAVRVSTDAIDASIPTSM
jgi:hypothetical protein